MERVFIYQRKENLKTLARVSILAMGCAIVAMILGNFFSQYTYAKEWIPFVNHIIFGIVFLLIYPILIAYRKYFIDFPRAVENTILRKQYLWSCWVGKIFTYFGTLAVLSAFLYFNQRIGGQANANVNYLFSANQVTNYYPWLITIVILTHTFFDHCFLLGMRFGPLQVLIPLVATIVGIELFVYPVIQVLFQWLAHIGIWMHVPICVLLILFDLFCMQSLLHQDIR